MVGDTECGVGGDGAGGGAATAADAAGGRKWLISLLSADIAFYGDADV